MARPEPRNPFYFLLLLVSLLFVATAFGYALVPIMEQKAADAGQPPPPSAFRQALREDGWKWLLWELAGMVVSSGLSLGLDRWRTLQSERTSRTMPPAAKRPATASGGEGGHDPAR